MLPKKLKTLAMIACFTLPCIKNLGATEICPIFTAKQKDVLQTAYDYGSEHGMGWSMAAIAWKESSAGKRMVNWSDPSFGVYHVLLKNAAHSKGFSSDLEPLRAISVAARLVYDHDYSAKESLKVLKFWNYQHEGDWIKTWASYNAGYNWTGPAGQRYTKDIQKKIRYLKNNNCVQY